VIALAACALLVHAEARHYHDARTLWEATIAENDAAALAQVSLGIELMKDPQRTPADEARAKQLFEAGARDPNMRDQAYSNLGQWSLVRGDVATAITDFRRAIEADPAHKRARAGLAEALLRRTQALGATSAGLRSARDAGAEFPGDSRFLQFEAWILSVSADATTRDPARARAIAEGLVARSPRDYGLLDTLAVACAASGDFPSAIQHAESAVRLAPPAARGPFESRLALYRRGERYVEPPPR
jgi:Flp pilus assembly protein TadD